MASSKPTTVENHLKTGGESLHFNNRLEVTNKIADQCQVVFQELKIRRKHRYITFMIGNEEIVVDKVGGRNETFDNFKASLPYTECRYCIYDQDLKTPDGRNIAKLWFICWIPNYSTPYHKMAYTSAKIKFRETLIGVFDMQAASIEELESNLGLAAVDDEDDKDFDF
mmetsp:Transcript_28967/g.39790  ORF Transcript_28967/g.39790 Transcript_28967/m.39790 type:complete len:168 (-) Transcript_28967:14-517(-)